MPATVSETCASGTQCKDGSCVAVSGPTSVTIGGSFGDVDPIIANGPDGIAGVLSVAPPPTFSVDLPSLPDLAGASKPAVISPPLGGCDLDMSFTLNSSEVSAMLSGTGDACVAFLESAANNGFEVQFDDVPYQDGTGTLDVTLDLHP